MNDGIVTSAGVAAGIDMAFHVAESFCGKEVADETARYIEYPQTRFHVCSTTGPFVQISATLCLTPCLRILSKILSGGPAHRPFFSAIFRILTVIGIGQAHTLRIVLAAFSNEGTRTFFVATQAGLIRLCYVHFDLLARCGRRGWSCRLAS